MSIKILHKTFWLRTAAIFMVVALVLSSMPVQPANAAAAGFFAPTTYHTSAIQNPGNAYASDNLYAQSSGNNKSAVYGNFGFQIPSDAIVNLVEVKVESYGTKNWKVSVSNNGGAKYSSAVVIPNTLTENTTTVGGPGVLWGLPGWTPSSLNDGNFRVKIASAGGGNQKTAYLDQLTVRVIYTTSDSIPTTLVVTSLGAGTYGGTTDLQATLTATSTGLPLSGQTISFSMDGLDRGTATTNASGVATLLDVPLTTGLSNTVLNVGTYSIAARYLGDITYAFSSDTDSQVVNPLPVTVTANAQSKVYGSADPALTYTSNPAPIGGDLFGGALARNPGEAIGTYPITLGTLTLGANYSITFVGANLSITPLGLTIKADNKAMRVGSLTDPAFTYGTSRFAGTDTFITPPTCGVSAAHSTVGTYPITCSGANAGPNYTITYEAGTLTVTNKYVLDVTADPKTVTYGDPDPAFTYKFSGFVDGDTDITGTKPTCGITGAHTNAGSYHNIVCSGGSDVKYEFSYTSGSFKVNPKPITVTADPKSKTYGTVDPVLTYGFSPALVTGDSFTGALSRTAGENVNVYPILQSSLALGPNYAITYVGANLTITKALLTVTADDQTIGFGMPDPSPFTFTYEGFVNAENSSVIDTPPTCGVSGDHSAIGSYPITCSGGLDNNYSFDFVEGTLTIVPNEVDNFIGGNWLATYPLNPSQSTRVSYNLDSGPVKIASKYGFPIIASERINLKANTLFESYGEVMGLPASKLSDTYTFPWYNNTGFLDSQIRFANVGNANTVVTIKIAGVAQPVTYPLAPNQGARVTFAGVDNGPVEVKSSGGVPIIAAMRINLKVNSPYTSYSEFLGLSASSAASTRYVFPWYNNTGLLDSQLRFANVGNATTTVTIKIGGVTQPVTYTLSPSQSTRISYPSLDSGPVEVTSSGGVPITAAMRINLKNNTSYTSYTELMGMTGATLTDTRFLFPWYNNTGSLDSQLRFANVGSANTIVSIKINGVVQAQTYALRPNESVRVSLAGVDSGPVEVYSSGGVPIIAALRINLKASPSYDSYYEFMGMSVGAPLGLPTNQLSPTYWFPWYNNTGLLDSQLRFGIP